MLILGGVWSEAVTDGEILQYFVLTGIWSPFHSGTGLSLEITHCVNVRGQKRENMLSECSCELLVLSCPCAHLQLTYFLLLLKNLVVYVIFVCNRVASALEELMSDTCVRPFLSQMLHVKGVVLV